jgi:hypothetical protein
MSNTPSLVVPHAVAAIGANQELFTDASLCGLTMAWLPGDHGLTILVGGGIGDDGQMLQPALSVFVHAMSVPRLLALVERMVSFTPLFGAPERFPEPISDHEVKWNLPPREAYDPTISPFGTVEEPYYEPNYWRRHARCIILAQGSQFSSTPRPNAEEDPFRRELDQEPEDGYGTRPHPEDPAGWSGRITAYSMDEPGWRPHEHRRYVLDFLVDGRLRVYLDQHEASDLFAVLRHHPTWVSADR